MNLDDGPVYVEPFLGAGATWLHLLDPRLVPLVSWMGGKRRDAHEHLKLLGLRPGHPIPALLGDASWWGWVWPTVLDPDTGPEVSTMLRFWRNRDPRELWFRLRDWGPLPHPVEAAAQFLWLQARAASGVPVWWEGTAAVLDRGWKSPTCSTRTPFPATQCNASDPRLLANTRGAQDPGTPFEAAQKGPPRLLQEASTQVDDAGQSRTRGMADPRLIQKSNGRGPYTASMSGDQALLLAFDGRGDPRVSGQRPTLAERLDAGPSAQRGGAEGGGDREGCGKGVNKAGAGGILDPGTIADRADAVRARLVKASGGEAGFGYDDGFRRGKGWRAFDPGDVASRADAVRIRAIGISTILHADAVTLTNEWASDLRARALVYLDPPYQGATGYPVACPREDVLVVAETWARAGARVVLSEAVSLADELGSGWAATQLRASKKPEWVTTYGCDVRDVLPPILRACAT